MVDAQEAERIGLVTMVVPHEDLETTVFETGETGERPADGNSSGTRGLFMTVWL